jgi:hypothetical protein
MLRVEVGVCARSHEHLLGAKMRLMGDETRARVSLSLDEQNAITIDGIYKTSTHPPWRDAF